MGWIDKILRREIQEVRASPENPSVSVSDFSAVSTYFPAGSSSVSVTDDTVLGFSAVFAGIRIISEAIASLPLQVYERTTEGKVLASEHPLYNLLHNSPNPNMTSFIFRETMMANTIRGGNSYAKIIRKGSQDVVELEFLDPATVEPKMNGKKLVYKVDGQDLSADKILHISGLGFDGIKGKSLLDVARENIELALSAQKFGANYFKNGANLSGVIEHPARLSSEAATRLRNSWNAKYSGINNSHSTAILEEGAKFTKIGSTPNESQFTETRKFMVTEMARLLLIPPHKLADLEKASFSNIEQQSIDFVVYCIRPWLVRWEQEMNRKLFKVAENGRYFVEFNLSGLLRGDSAARGEFYLKMLQNGVFSINDVRSLENMNAVAGGDEHFVQLNMIPLSKAVEYAESVINKPSAPAA